MMVENIYLCHRCGNIFRYALNTSPPPEEKPPCPQCGESSTREMPSWVPAGSDLAHATTEWDYECQGCRAGFKLPVPRSPSQEKDIICPSCHGTHIHRLTPAGYEPLYCG